KEAEEVTTEWEEGEVKEETKEAEEVTTEWEEDEKGERERGSNVGLVEGKIGVMEMDKREAQGVGEE
ncbi:hypothetical protein GW17_00046645, partial [Ensete ventricosum]